MSMKYKALHLTALLIFLGMLSRCQAPATKISETDEGFEGRAFSKIQYGEKVDLKRVVIADVRSRFKHEMSRPPRSFHAYWKDWDLSGYSGAGLENKKKELQRLLSLQGVDPLVKVVVMGDGLSGNGEEFLVATTLISLGVQRVGFMPAKQAREAMVARNIPKLENLPYWEKPMPFDFNCELKESKPMDPRKKADIVVEGNMKEFFSKDMELKRTKFPKTTRSRVYSPKGFWAYGVALHLKEQGRQVCVIRVEKVRRSFSTP